MNKTAIACVLTLATNAALAPAAALTIARPMIDFAVKCNGSTNENDKAVIPYRPIAGSPYQGTVCVDRSRQATHLPVDGMKQMLLGKTGEQFMRITIDHSKGPLLSKFGSDNYARRVIFIVAGNGIAEFEITGPVPTEFDMFLDNGDEGPRLTATVLGGPMPGNLRGR